MKKIIVLLLAAVMLLSLAACGEKTPAPSGSDDKPGASAPAPSGQGGTEATEVENKVDLSVDATHYEQNGTISVTLDFGKLNKENAVIVIVNSDTEHGTENAVHDTYEEYRYLSDFSELPFYMSTPLDKDGLFDVRVYANDDGGEELASITIAVGNVALPDSSGGNNTGNAGTGNPSDDGGKGGILTESGDCTQKQMEDTIVSYFASISNLSTLTLCNGSSITYSKADIPWQTVDIWDINDPAITYGELASLMSSQLTAAGFAEENMSIGGYKWLIAVGDKAMRIELRPEDWAEGAYEIYATPEAE